MVKISKSSPLIAEKTRQARLARSNDQEHAALMRELARRERLNMVDFLLVTSASLDRDGEHGLFSISEAAVSFVGLNLSLSVSTADRQRRNVISSLAPTLPFPCTSDELLTFLATPLASEHFRADDLFLEALQKKAVFLEAATPADADKRAVLSENARRGGEAKKANSPKEAAKKKIKQEWEAMEEGKMTYKNHSDFARKMVDKYPEITSVQVVQRWVRLWRDERKAGRS